MATIFDFSLFKGLPAAVESKSTASFLRPLSISRNTWQYWLDNNDLPVVKFLDICRHYGYDPALFLDSGKGQDTAESDRTPRFRSRLFSDALSLFRHLTVAEACRSLGISTATFARQLRNRKSGTPSLTVNRYLEWCDKAGLNPTDYIYDGEVSIKVSD